MILFRAEILGGEIPIEIDPVHVATLLAGAAVRIRLRDQQDSLAFDQLGMIGQMRSEFLEQRGSRPLGARSPAVR